MGKDDRTKKACMITNLKNFRRTRIRERWMCIMSKNKGLGLVSALAVGAGVAAVAAGKKYKTAETKKKEEYDALHFTTQVNTAIQSVENMRKTAKEFIIPMVTMKHLPARENRKA